jgi:CheY-like chemotaxis protein
MAVNPDMDVLIVDDASAMRRIARGLLKELGFKNIRDAGNGQSALDELKKKRADFVVSEWNLPGKRSRPGLTITSPSRSTRRRSRSS